MKLEEFQRLKQSHKRVALYREIDADHLTPISAFKTLGGTCILETAPGSGEGRYSFIGINPIAVLEVREGDPFEALRKFQEEFKTFASHYTIAGYVAYDAVRTIEKIPERHPDVLHLPHFFFQYYASSVVFDHQTNRAILAVNAEEYEAGMEELNRLESKIHQNISLQPIRKLGSKIQCDLSDDEFSRMVEKAKEHILAGDIFQIVLSRTFSTQISGEPFEVYRALRQSAPAPFLFFFDLGDYAIAGASPEKIISVQNGTIESTPIAGTRPKDSSEEELLSDPKEIAEHVMLVDLARNDVGAVSVAGSVKVTEFKKIYSYSHVMHIVSRVEGKLDSKYDAIDAFKASFPAGTLTGAPKIRAMELIDQYETSRRGVYGGAIVALDGKGNLMSCIAIRTAFIKDGIVSVRAGAGIVLDSVPENEAQETRHKANTVLGVL